MADRRGVEPLEPELGMGPVLREVGDRSAEDVPSLCVDLRRARMTAGYELADIATALRIRLLYLEALEEGRFEDLPGSAYAAGFLRSYCEFLGLQSNEMVERLKRETAGGAAQRDLTFPVPPKEGRNPKPWLVLVVVLLAGLAYGGWHVYSTEGKLATNLVSDVSNKFTEAAGLTNDKEVMAAVATESVADEEVAVAQPVEVGNAMTQKAEQSVDTPAQTASGQTPVAATAAGTMETSPTPDVAPSASDNSPPLRSDSLWDSAAANQPDTPAVMEAFLPRSGDAVPIIRNANAQAIDGAGAGEFDVASAPGAAALPVHKPNIYGEENTDFRIAIRATADSWVQIQGPNNELLLTRILRTGDIYQVPNRSGLIMVTGNAGALELRVDGSLIGALGPIGVVRRNVSLDPEVLAAGSEADR